MVRELVEEGVFQTASMRWRKRSMPSNWEVEDFLHCRMHTGGGSQRVQMVAKVGTWTGLKWHRSVLPDWTFWAEGLWKMESGKEQWIRVSALRCICVFVLVHTSEQDVCVCVCVCVCVYTRTRHKAS